MEKLPQVVTAKALMTEAMRWSVMKWLREKKRVRQTADQANAALDQLSLSVRKRWPNDLQKAYDALAAKTGARNSGKKSQNGSAKVELALKVKDADDQAFQARMDAEHTFDEADRKLSTALAREGCLKAIRAWELQEQAIQKAQDLDVC
jgi:hypothetical protein